MRTHQGEAWTSTGQSWEQAVPAAPQPSSAGVFYPHSERASSGNVSGGRERTIGPLLNRHFAPDCFTHGSQHTANDCSYYRPNKQWVRRKTLLNAENAREPQPSGLLTSPLTLYLRHQNLTVCFKNPIQASLPYYYRPPDMIAHIIFPVEQGFSSSVDM